MNQAFNWSDLDHPPEQHLRLLIEASAGTGKTYTLERMVVWWLLRYRMPISAILVVTFTRKATRELRSRIRKLLVRICSEPDFGSALLAEIGLADLIEGDWRSHLQEQVRLFHQAEIHTIHGFAHAVLARFPAESGTLSRLVIDNGIISDLIRDEVLATVVSGQVPVCFGAEGGEVLAGDDLDFCLDQAFAVFKCRNSENLLERLVELHDKGLFDPGQFQFGLSAGHDPEAAWICLRQRHWQTIRQLVSANAGSNGAAAADAVATPEAVLALETDLARFIPGLPCGTPETLAESLARFCAFSLARFLVLGLEHYRQRQARYLGIIGHNDLLAQLDQASAPGSLLLQQIQNQYRLILIDEFQDTDSRQWGIFSRLAAQGDLVAVGDPKQAIYGFRGADLNTYLKAKKALANTRILDRNFRSSHELITGFNALFTASFAATIVPGPAPRLSYQALRAGQAEASAQTIMDGGSHILSAIQVLMPEAASAEAATAMKQADFKHQLIGAMAERIATLCDGLHSYRGESGSRPLSPGDITILCSTGADCQLVLRDLQAAGIPACLSGHGRLLEGPEAAELQILLDALEDPGDLARVKAAALTRFFGLAPIEARSADHQAQLSGIMDELQAWHEQYARLGLPGIHARLEQRIRMRLLQTESSQALRTLTNFQHLVELFMEQLANRHLAARSIGEEFRRYRQQSQRLDEIPLRRESDAPRVHIMTMHSSKGLEFPVVFVFGDFREFPAKKDSVWYEMDCATSQGWIRSVDPWHSPAGKSGQLERRREEWLRLFYVAATRAQALLCLPGFANDKSHYRETLDSGCVEKARQAIDVLRQSRSAGPEFRTDSLDQSAQKSTLGPGQEVLALQCALPSQVPSGWVHALYPAIERQSSFTSLSRRLGEEGNERPGFGTQLPGRESDETPQLPPENSLAPPTLPVGSAVGILFHSAMESIDFSLGAPELAADARRQALLEFCAKHIEPASRGMSFGPGFPGFSHFSASFADLLAGTLTMTLPSPQGRVIEMHRIANASRMVEVPFHARVAQAGKMENAGASIDLPTGFLTGIIDLVFVMDGRWHIIDWKTNLVGDGGCQEVMDSHRYDLQALIYQSAVHQFLCSRAKLDWNPHRHQPGSPQEAAARQIWATHMGRTWYVFVRTHQTVDATQDWTSLVEFQKKAGLHVN